MVTATQLPELLIDMQGGFRLRKEYRYTFENGNYIVVPAGYKTNFASIPAFARMFLSPIDPDLVIASIVHDWVIGEFTWHRPIDAVASDYFQRVIYGHPASKASALSIPEGARALCEDEFPNMDIIVDKHISRIQAAAIMRNVMRETGCPVWKRQLIYGSLRSYEAIKIIFDE